MIDGINLIMDADLGVYALMVRNGGCLLWRDKEMGWWLSQHGGSFLCAGFVAIETSSKFEMSVLDPNNMTWVYITNNGTYLNLKHAHFERLECCKLEIVDSR